MKYYFVKCTYFSTGICSDLPSLTNGMISYNADGGIRLVDSTATHSCDNGYALAGVSVRTCGSDGEWSGSAPVCQSKE